MILIATALPALAEDRIALVVGNGGYSHVTALDNPVPDAQAVAGALEQAGFDVTLLTETDQAQLLRGIAQFGSKLRAAGPEATGLFYYAGHGVQSFGTNYLVPVDAVLSDAADLGLVAVGAQTVLRQMYSAANRTNIVILDACRDNPFATVAGLDEAGLAEMNAPRGTFLAYSTSPGSVAVDGEDGNSPFSAALATRIPTPGLAIEQLFKDVRIDVLKATGGFQTPWDTSSLTEDFTFVAAPKQSPEDFAALQLWTSVKATNDPVQLLLFLRLHGNSPYADEARTLLATLMEKELGRDATTAPQPEIPATPSRTPEEDERDALEAARTAGTAEGYRQYLDAYPDGAYAELARLELATIEEKAGAAAPAPVVPDTTPPAITTPPETVTFTGPIGTGGPDFATKSIQQLIEGTPFFPPIENLPDEVWKDKTCHACHEWTQEALCTQAKTYLTEAGTRALAKEHPLGGFFKNTLKAWAQNDCR
ncbi:caspase family protein [Pseudooceanicola sp. C21-150M6]|uniref:caspase family protein n=1 Tax=Pseudooceanicola sp. C21-150M6 TaxID=3434355 RepID=UPI003D8000A4